jgi:hypothetical protein
VVARAGLIEKRYTKIGTAKIEPPAPIRPIETPIKMDNKYPKISITKNKLQRCLRRF